MNKSRRQKIECIIRDIDTVLGMIDNIRYDIDEIRSDEQEALWNLPESIQNSEKGDVMQNAIDNLESAYDIDVEDSLIEMQNYLEEAKE